MDRDELVDIYWYEAPQCHLFCSAQHTHAMILATAKRW
jgi:hypothetical protein